MPMPQISDIMQNDSLAARLAKDHDYVRSLVGEPVAQRPVTDSEPIGENILKAIGKFLASIPWEVWAVIGILLLAWIAIKIYLKIDKNPDKKDDVEEDAEGGTDNIYAIDFDTEFNEALGKVTIQPLYVSYIFVLYANSMKTGVWNGSFTRRLSSMCVSCHFRSSAV